MPIDSGLMPCAQSSSASARTTPESRIPDRFESKRISKLTDLNFKLICATLPRS